MRPGSRWSTRRRIVVGLTLSIATLWLFSATAVLWYASRDRATPSDAIVVLGAAQYRGRPSPVLKARLDHAIGLYARGLAPRLVLTGGTAEGDTASEALVSRQYALQAGVPDSALLLENDGRTTNQSLRLVSQLLLAHGTDRVIVVSDPFHVLRAAVVARRLGLQVSTSPTTSGSVWTRVARQPGYFLEESVKAPMALLFGW